MIYCIADIHGEYERYLDLLSKINFNAQDTLYVLGDVVDRGPRPMEVLLDMMARPNVIPLLGNHELMALRCLRFLMTEITEQSVAALDGGFLGGFASWRRQGGKTTEDGFRKLSRWQREDVMEYLGEFQLYEELSVGGRRYVLVHAGLGRFAPDRPLDDYAPDELIWERPDYSRAYFPDRYLVTGHTPTRNIPENPRPDQIFRANNHIAIDCGSVFGGRLGSVCLDTGEEFYSDC